MTRPVGCTAIAAWERPVIEVTRYCRITVREEGPHRVGAVADYFGHDVVIYPAVWSFPLSRVS